MPDLSQSGDSLFGVHPGCGCVSAWLSIKHSTAADIRRFHLGMAATGRDVQRGDLTDQMRAKLGRCPHKEA
jgi:hypothetical protein